MEDETIELTRELIEGLKRNGAFTTATIEALGLKWRECRKGWTFRLIGKRIKTSDYDKAFAGREVLAREHRQNKREAKHPSIRERMETAAEKPDNQAYYDKIAEAEYPLANPETDEVKLRRAILAELRDIKQRLKLILGR